MDLFPNDMQEELIGQARAMLRRELPVEAMRWQAPSSPPADVRALATFADLGWYALGIAEDRGGVGFGPAEEVLLLVEAGRYLAPLGLVAAMLAAHLAADAGEADLLQAIAGGACRVGLALAPTHAGAPVKLLGAEGADLVLLFDGDGAALHPVAALSDRTALPALDETVTLEQAMLDPGQAVARIADAAGLARHRDLLAAAYCTGLAEQVMAIAIEYACTRQQFGQPIGAFQGVKHPCADMASRSEAAHWQTMLAALSLGGDSTDADYLTQAAAIVALEAAQANAAAAVQVHGGMGFTAECPVHFYVKRAHVLDRLVGGRAARIDAMLQATAPEMIRH